MRDFLGQTPGQHTTVLSWISAELVGNKHSTVAITSGQFKAEPGLTSGVNTALARVMDFLPLKEAFGEFCRMALCSEVRTSSMYARFCAAAS